MLPPHVETIISKEQAFNALANSGYIPLVTVGILMVRDCVWTHTASALTPCYLFPGGEVNHSDPCISVSEPWLHIRQHAYPQTAWLWPHFLDSSNGFLSYSDSVTCTHFLEIRLVEYMESVYTHLHLWKYNDFLLII